MDNKSLAPHEAIEVREFLNQEVISIKSISTTLNIVKDQELKQFMQDSLESKRTAVQEITSIISSNVQEC